MLVVASTTSSSDSISDVIQSDMGQVLNCRIEVTEKITDTEALLTVKLSTVTKSVWSITVVMREDIPEDMRRELAYDMAMKEFGDYLLKLEPPEPDNTPIMHHPV